MSRKKLARPKKQRHLQLAYMHLLEELKPALAPSGLDLSDGQAIDVAVATMHELLVEKRGIIVDPDKMLALMNRILKTELSRFFAEAMTKAGHGEVKSFWNADGGITVTWDEGRMEVPAAVFSGERMDKDALLRELKAEGRVS